MRRAFSLFGLSATLAVAWSSLLPSQALATVTGPCTVSIDGVDVTSGHDAPGSAVPLRSGSRVPVDGTAQSRVTDLTYTVLIAGGGVQVGTVTIAEDGLGWSGTVDLESISDVTVGLFEVTIEVQTTGRDCSGVAYVCIEGRNPFTTAAGAGATVVGVGGGILLVLSFIRARRLGAARAPLQGFAAVPPSASAARSCCSSSASSRSRRRAPWGSRWSSGRSAPSVHRWLEAPGRVGLGGSLGSEMVPVGAERPA
jgi:hypothetical protein